MGLAVNYLSQKPVRDKESHFYLHFVAGEMEAMAVGAEEGTGPLSSQATWSHLAQHTCDRGT